MPNFRKSAGYVMKSSLAKLTSALKLSGAWKERPQDIRKPMKEGAGTIAKKVSPAKLAPSMKDPKYGARKRPKPGGGKKIKARTGPSPKNYKRLS